MELIGLLLLATEQALAPIILLPLLVVGVLTVSAETNRFEGTDLFDELIEELVLGAGRAGNELGLVSAEPVEVEVVVLS